MESRVHSALSARTARRVAIETAVRRQAVRARWTAAGSGISIAARGSASGDGETAETVVMVAMRDKGLLCYVRVNLWGCFAWSR